MISPATPADLPALAALERAVFAHEVYPGFFFRQAHDLWPRWLLVARDEAGAVTGYVLGAPAAEAGRAWLLSAATAPDARGRGVGARLLQRLLEGMASEDIRDVRLTVHPDNPARRLYERTGFAPVAQDAAYFGPGEPRLVLSAALGAAHLHVLDTPRLTLRRFTLADAPFIVALLNSPGWLRAIGDRGVRTEAEARAYLLRGAFASHAEHGFALWHVARRDTGEAVGMCGLIRRPYLDVADVGFAFLPAHTGQGYATEAAAATIEHARSVLQLPGLGAIVLPDNAASLRVLHKLGFAEAGRITPPGSTQELALLRRSLAGDART